MLAILQVILISNYRTVCEILRIEVQMHSIPQLPVKCVSLSKTRLLTVANETQVRRRLAISQMNTGISNIIFVSVLL